MKKYLIIPLLIFIIFLFDIGCDRKTKATILPPVDTTKVIIVNSDTITEPEPEPEPEPESEPEPKPEPIIIKTIREKLLDSLNTQLYVREITPNRAPMIDIYLKTVKTQVGVAWCAAFVGANLTWQGIENPNSAWSPNYARSKDIIWTPKGKNNKEPLTGDVITFYYTKLGRVGHAGFYEKEDNYGYFITIEGNTNGAGSREGDGVYKKKRDPNKSHAISRYIID